MQAAPHPWPPSREPDGLSGSPDADLLERELRIAQRIQRTLVQLAGVEADGWEITSEYQPARSIGGDFFDVFPILDPARPRQLGVVIADVSGKGISAALLMAFVRPVMRSALDRSADPVEALERTNAILVDERRTGLFVTVLAGVLELDTGWFTYANAGHELPVIVAAGEDEARPIPGGGPLVGMFGRLGVTPLQLRIEPGDALVLYTDGVTDARAPDGERYGEARFLAALARRAGGRGPAPCRDVVDEVFAKANGLDHPEMIQWLYQASQAGVKVELMIRGICSLRPGVPGVSENITVTSIVGRFLEHARIYWFANNGHEEAYVGSADLLPRNLDHRVEVVFPIEDPRLLRRLKDEIIDSQLKDTANVRELRPDGSYVLRRPEGDAPAFDSQAHFIEVA